jgi:hypothetical protein
MRSSRIELDTTYRPAESNFHILLRGPFVEVIAEEDALDQVSLMLCPTIEKGSNAWNWAVSMLYTASMMSDHRQRLLEEKLLPEPIPKILIFKAW